MIDWGELFRNAADYELTTWAGILNLASLLLIAAFRPAKSVADAAIDAFVLLVEGSRKYRAARRGVAYDPVVKRRRAGQRESAAWKVAVVLFVFFVGSVAVIAAVEEVSPVLSAVTL